MLRSFLSFNNLIRAFYIFGFIFVARGNHLSLIDQTTFHTGLGIFSFFSSTFWKILTPSTTFLLLAASTLNLMASPESWKSRLVWWFSATCIIHFYFMAGHTNYHSFHLMLYVSFFFIFLNTNSTFQRTLVLNLTLAVIGVVYFSSGLWKFLEIMNLILDGKLSNFYMIIIDGLAYATAEGSPVSPVCKTLVLSSSAISSFAWIYTVSTELLGGVIIFRPKFVKIWIPLIICLHFGVGSCLGIWFTPAVGTLAFFWALWLLNQRSLSSVKFKV